ncbi:hypothetical protein D3C81_1881970 [compost metagenome]
MTDGHVRLEPQNQLVQQQKWRRILIVQLAILQVLNRDAANFRPSFPQFWRLYFQPGAGTEGRRLKELFIDTG